MAEIKWIKITTDIFDDEKMKIIDTLPDRDAIIVIWFKLLAITGKKNESGLLFLSPKMAYTDEMLATVFNRPLNTVRLALTTFENFGMIEIADNQVISIVNWEKHQNIDGMEKVKNQSLLRQRKSEIKRKLVLLGYTNKESEEIAEKEKEQLPSNVILRYTNGTDKIRLDKNRLELEENIKPIVQKDLNVSFDTFWNEYDYKKGNKANIEKKWNKLKDQERVDIMEYLPRYKRSTPDKQYRKQPQTFLNGRAWEDEIIEKKGFTTKQPGFVATEYTEDDKYSLEGMV